MAMESNLVTTKCIANTFFFAVAELLVVFCLSFIFLVGPFVSLKLLSLSQCLVTSFISR